MNQSKKNLKDEGDGACQFIDCTTVNTYQCRIRALQGQVESLKNGEAFLKLRASYESLLSERDRTIKRLELELADAHARIVTVRRYWSEIFDDVDRECRAKIGRLGREVERLKKRIFEAERQRDEALDRLRERTKGEKRQSRRSWEARS